MVDSNGTIIKVLDSMGAIVLMAAGINGILTVGLFNTSELP